VASFAPESIVSITDSLPVAFTTDDFSAHPSLPVPIYMMTATITVTPTPSIRDIAILRTVGCGMDIAGSIGWSDSASKG
jgi:hypothetical protein